MSNCDKCSSEGSCNNKEGCNKIFQRCGNIKKVIGIMSGKGGVGKSTLTGITAVLLQNKGYKVGVLDADITGPSMPRFFGINNLRAVIGQMEDSESVKFEPVVTKSGIKVMSMNLLTEDEESPVIWRGPIITGVLNQMYQDTVWGDLDYLLIDMPPGTGDVPLTIMQSFPIDYMLMVATPQAMVTMIVKKAAIMAEKLGVNILGVVENMAYIKCGSCGNKQNIFSSKPADYYAKELGLPLLYEFPIDTQLTERIEEGMGESYISHNSYFKDFIELIIDKLNKV
ncbi:MAG TPA: Mrp/NBP35 family ATP-binding protein [Clostridiaceae bacterium]